MSYILFYSNYCNYSRKFINILENSGEACFFVKICVDKDQAGKRPVILSKYKVVEVPTIIVENRKLPGYAAFKWLHTRIENSHTTVNSLPSRQNKQSVNPQTLPQRNQVQEDVIEPFSSGASAFLDNCLQVGDMTSTKIHTPKEEEDVDKGTFTMNDDLITANAMEYQRGDVSSTTIKKDRLKSKQFENEYNRLLQERDACVSQPKPRF